MLPLQREISDHEGLVAYLRDVVAHPDAHPEVALPDDPSVRAALDEPGPRERALMVAARHLPDWPGGLIGLVPADETVLLALWKETPVAKRRAFVDAVVAAGDEHLDALIAGARRLIKLHRELGSPLMMMLGPHLPDPTSGELLVEQMVDVLRRNRQRPDTDEGKAAERVLQDPELWTKRPEAED